MYQKLVGQTSCNECTPGGWCNEGAGAPEDCPEGTYSSEYGLVNSSQCSPCPIGYYCEPGASQPEPCPEGKVGLSAMLGSRLFCTDCPSLTTSTAGSSECPMCVEGYYREEQLDGTGQISCAQCLSPGGVCPTNTTLATVQLLPGYWRLSSRSATLYTCASDSTGTCAGGSDAGEPGEYTGSGYCEPGHTGPLCQVCAGPAGEVYFDDDAGRCEECPSFASRLTLPLVVIAVLVVVALAVARALRNPEGRLRLLLAEARRLVVRVQELELMPRFKLLLGFYQLAATLPDVYAVELPEIYHVSLATFQWFSLNFDGYLFPGACITGLLGLDGQSSFRSRLLVRGLAPLVIIGAIPMATLVLHFGRSVLARARSSPKAADAADDEGGGAAQGEPSSPGFAGEESSAAQDELSRLDDEGGAIGKKKKHWLKEAIFTSIPISLLLSYCLCPTVSKGVFATWRCDAFELEAASGVERSFLSEDPTVVCTDGADYTEAHEELQTLAYVLVLIWVSPPRLEPRLRLPLIDQCSHCCRDSPSVCRSCTRYCSSRAARR